MELYDRKSGKFNRATGFQRFHDYKPWEPGTTRRAPWTAIAALSGASMCTAGMAIILAVANGKDADQWPARNTIFQPAVLLSALSTVTNALLLFAYQDAAVIAWWIKILRGMTITEAHRSWQYAGSLWKSITAMRSFNTVAFACLAMGLVVIDGPLVQRALQTSARQVSHRTNFSVSFSQAPFPDGYSGVYMTRSPSVSALKSRFIPVVREYVQRSPIVLPVTTCRSKCRGSVVGPGFDYDCQRKHESYSIEPRPGIEYNVGYAQVNFMTNSLGFSNTIDVDTKFKDTPGSKGSYTMKSCKLRFGRVNYDISISNTSMVTLHPRQRNMNETIEILDMYRETFGLGEFGSALGGIAYAANTIYGSNVSLYFTGTFAIEGKGPLASVYLNTTDAGLGSTNMTWLNPTDDILDAIREMAFRAAVSLSNSTTLQNVSGIEDGLTAIYGLHGAYLAGAIAAIIFGMAAICILFWGWWRLGRSVSMSPIEIARAFGAQIFQTEDSNADLNDVLKELGSKKIRYGVQTDRDASARDVSQSNDGVTGRLQIGEDKVCFPPVPGRTYTHSFE
ncbi:hypothetical protein NECHADRAFT_75613 [Paecilomyces variotii No. 5]|uniref:Uncharacterized protein n=1 Tax=Byssochlamys spectabilis (strain No. 5 / NBRC 109023) TaxID=1356009 RepID=V5FYL2_BYSSN|nr:hypothetical protein NECHADRAFT_75613 [Paecilomyces variotii No. 5]